MPDAPPALSHDRPLRGETVVFFGRLWSRGRKDARALVEQMGGACDDDVTLRTTLLVVGAGSYPDGMPDPAVLLDDTSTHAQKLRRVAQINAEQSGRIRVLSEDEFCRQLGLPAIDVLRSQHYGQKDILAMYPALREDHLRYLQKWGFIRPAFRNHADTYYGFTDLTTLKQVHADLQAGAPFRGVLRDMQAGRSGQLAFDFRIDAERARILQLRPARRAGGGDPSWPSLFEETGEAGFDVNGMPTGPLPRELTSAEQYFLMGSIIDTGSPDHMEEAAQAYRRALSEDPDLVAALINLANIRYAKDELAEAQALYERAIGLDPSYFEAHFNLGNIHHDHGRFSDAELCYRTAIGLNSAYADAHFYLAVTLEKMGRSPDARVHWKAYQELAPNGEWVELAREFCD
jgi:tetratricopeptide (TPR) repeat protein